MDKTDIRYYTTTNIPGNDTAIGGGAVNTANEILNLDTNKIFNTVASGETDVVRYGKVHIKNTNTSEVLSGFLIYLKNSILNPVVDGVLTFTIAAAADNNSKFFRIYGENTAGTPMIEDLTLPSSPGNLNTVYQYKASRIVRVELRTVSGSNLIAAAGDIIIKDAGSNTLGKIPAGGYNATGEFEIGLASSLDDTTVIETRLSAPSGITFSRAVGEANGLQGANSGSLTAGSNQSVWVKWTLQAGSLPSTLFYADIAWKGTV